MTILKAIVSRPQGVSVGSSNWQMGEIRKFAFLYKLLRGREGDSNPPRVSTREWGRPGKLGSSILKVIGGTKGTVRGPSLVNERARF